MSSAALEVVRVRADACILVLRGEHDIATRARLADMLEGLIAHDELVVVDVSQAEFIDASIVATILEAHAMAARRGTCVRLQSHDTAAVGRVLEITGLSRLVDTFDSRATALGIPETASVGVRARARAGARGASSRRDGA